MFRRLGFVVLCLMMSACGGDDSPETPPDGGVDPGGPPVVRGGERLIWDQRADSLAAARGYTYRLYVDGVVAAFSNVSCSGVVSAAGFECSGTLPAMSSGRHTLELTSGARAGESIRSASLTVMVTPAGMTITGVETLSGDAAPPPAVDTICLGESGSECYRPHLVASTAESVNAIVPTIGDQALFISGEREIRLIAGNTVANAPALVAESDAARIVSLAVPVDYERSHYVYVAQSAPGRDHQPELSVARYRELQGVLAEGATVVGGLAAIEPAAAAMALDDAGRLYLQMAVRSAQPRAPSSGAVLRFQADGTVASDNPRFSPTIAYGYARPTATAWDRVAGRLWLAGDDTRWPSPVATLAAKADSHAAWPWSPTPLAIQRGRDGSATPRVTITAPSQRQDQNIWVVVSPGMVYRAIVRPGQAAQLTPVTFGTLDDVTLVAGTADGSLLVVSGARPSPGEPARIWRLEPIVPRQ